MRSAAWPSHSSGIARATGRRAAPRRYPRTMSAVCVPTTRLVPSVTVTGRSVFSRSVRHGMPSAVDSSCRPPESVRIRLRVRRQRQEVDVAERLGRAIDAVEIALETELAQPLARARVHRKHDRHLARRPAARPRRMPRKRLAIVHVRRPMQRQHRVGASPTGDAIADRDRASPAAGDGAACRSSRCRRGGSARPASLRRSRFSSASRDGVSSRSASRSVTMRLISSGIVRSRLRRPASTCAIGITSFAATSDAAIVEFTSPTTTTRSGRSARQTSSNADHHLRGLHGVAGRADAEIAVRRRQLRAP